MYDDIILGKIWEHNLLVLAHHAWSSGHGYNFASINLAPGFSANTQLDTTSECSRSVYENWITPTFPLRIFFYLDTIII